jgi:DNA-directed RNA polymerase subunit RPC12/RpoP
MQRQFFHGAITPNDVAQALLAEFNRGNLRAQALGQSEKMVVQIGTRPGAPSGGETALAVTIQKVEDGLMVELGQQAWLGVAASFGVTALTALRNPFALLHRLDDLAQDIENLQIGDQIWQVIRQTSQAAGASYALSERLNRMACEYCGSANPLSEPSCITCGAPLGDKRPTACTNCGFALKHGEVKCLNCGRLV